MVICLEQGANDLHMVQLMPLPPIITCFIKIQNGLPFRCWLTQVVREKRPLNGYNVVQLCTYLFLIFLLTHKFDYSLFVSRQLWL